MIGRTESDRALRDKLKILAAPGTYLNPKPRNPNPKTRNPKPGTLNPKP